MSKITPNKKRMQAYAKGGGLMGYRNGGGVLDQKQLGGVAKALKPVIKKVITKAKNFFSDLNGTTVDPELLKNTGYARKVDLENAIKGKKKNTTGSN